MKKLIPAFLAGVFTLTGVEALASNIIERVEFSDTKMVLNNWPLELDRNILSVQIRGSEDIYKFISIKDLVANFGHGDDWNAQTNTLELIEGSLYHYRQQRELHPIIEPIDMDNINSDEWINLWWSQGNTMMHSGHDGVVGIIEERVHPPLDMEIDYWFENYFNPEDFIRVRSTIGCNAQEIRSIFYINPNGFTDVKFNIQDIEDSGIFSDEETDELLGRIEREIDDIVNEWDEAAFAISMLQHIILSTNQYSFLDERLERLAEVARLQMSNN